GRKQLERGSVAGVRADAEGSPGGAGPMPADTADPTTTDPGPNPTEAGDRSEPDDGYVIRTCAGPVPEGHVEAIARLHQRMSTDVPGAADIYDEESWEDARVSFIEDECEVLGARQLMALARRRDM